MSPAPTRREVRPRTVRTRRIDFEYPSDDLPRHFVSDDPVMSSVVAVLSSLFPEGEDFFVRSVRAYRAQITDPELKQQVAGFIGQEAMHGREHRAFNERLAQLGYPTQVVDRFLARGFSVSERLPGKSRRLAVTAALEHYTATLAETLLTDQRARELLDVDEVRNLFLWHALEESEHKSVAFDVFQEVSGNHRIRTWVMNVTTAAFLATVVGFTTLSLALDPATYRRPGRVLRALRDLRHSPWLTSEIVARIRDYNRRDFHPDDHDATELLERWRAELFGPGGPLADRVKTADSRRLDA
jgi:predicted metal-dependent hydrolase